MRYICYISVFTLLTGCSGKGLPRELSGDAPGIAEIRSDALKRDPFYKKTARLFDDSQVSTIRVSIPKNTMSEVVLPPYCPVRKGKKVYGICTSITVNGKVFKNAGIRSRGNTSIGNYKRQFKIALDCRTGYASGTPSGKKTQTTTAGNNYHGIRKFNLRASQNDPSMLREKLATWIFARAGAPAPRTGFARLYINNSYWGLYIVTEQINRDCIRARFGSSKGPLYKAVHAKGRFSPRAMHGFEVKNGETAAGHRLLRTKFTDLASVKNLKQLASIFHLKNALNYLAAGIICGHWDSFLGIANNDYLYMHRDRKLRIIAWDLDNTFGSGLGWGFPTRTAGLFSLRQSSSGNTLFIPILGNRVWKRYYLNRIKHLLNTLFRSGAVYRKIDFWKNLIRTAVYKDPRKAVDWRFFDRPKSNSAWEAATGTGPLIWRRSGFGGYTGGLKSWLKERAAHLRKLLQQQ